MNTINPLSPAFGRDYTDKNALLLDYYANKDFKTRTGRYINKEQIDELKLKHIIFLFNNKSKVFTINEEMKFYG